MKWGLTLVMPAVWAALNLSAPPPSLAAPGDRDDRDVPTAARGTVDPQDAENNGSDLTRPETSFDLRFRHVDASDSDSRTDRNLLILQATTRFNLDANWKLGALVRLPVIDKTTTTTGTSDTVRNFGAGDTTFQAVLSRDINDRVAVGFGARFVVPTAEDRLGSGKWQIMPGFGVRYSLPEWGPDSYFVPAVRYAVSVAGDPARRNISEPQIAPTLNVGLPDRWFVTFYPSYDIRINNGDPISGQTGRLFLPFDVAVGRKLSDQFVVSLEVSVPIIKDYPVYDFKTELRFLAKF